MALDEALYEYFYSRLCAYALKQIRIYLNILKECTRCKYTTKDQIYLMVTNKTTAMLVYYERLKR